MLIEYQLRSGEVRRYETPSRSVVVGRDAHLDDRVDLDLDWDTTVSHVHARLTQEEEAFWIEDLGSTNGTIVDGEKITTKTRLEPTSKVVVGQTQIAVQPTSPATPAPAAKPQPEPTGDILAVTDAATPPFSGTKEPPEEPQPQQAWRQLKAFYDLSRGLATAKSVESMIQLLVAELQEAIHAGQRGAVLLSDEQGELLLKAHWPLGSHSVSMSLVRQAFDRQEAFIWTRTEDEKVSPSMQLSQVQSAIYAPLSFEDDVLGVICVDNYEQSAAFTLTDLELLRAIANQVAIFLKKQRLNENLQRQETLRANLQRQFSPQLAEHMLDECNRLRMGGERVNPVTILLADVRNFTALSATMASESVVRMLNEMFDAFVPIIFDHEGVIDKFIGDAVLVVFGSPQQDGQQWEHAVKAALAMQEALQKLQEGWRVRRLPIFSVGIGIHTGPVIHGFIGAAERVEYTVVGDTVNRTARYCDGAGRGEILISQETYEHVYRLVEVEPRTIRTKHPDAEPDLKGYRIEALKSYERPPTDEI
jgi:adenylate cyclase